MRASVRANRAFLARVVRWLATEAGIHQSLDIGSGIPDGTNVHAIAQAAARGARVVYVDNDDIVDEGATAGPSGGPPPAMVPVVRIDSEDAMPHPQRHEPHFYRVEEAAEILRISRSTAYEMANAWLRSDGGHGLPCIRLGRRLVVPRAVIEDWARVGSDPDGSTVAR